ncbi:MAG TPA: hypothetical protein PLU30_22490 [Verrucomicrobiae bacterium]|nr:hypothetical protein [Verrucomicrobiae bacterium]
MRLFKVLASRGGRIVFDERVRANCPREARAKLKERLRAESLVGIVYSITEIPLEILREIVDARTAELALRGPRRRVDVPRLLDAAVEHRLAPLTARVEALEAARGRTGAANASQSANRFDAFTPPTPAPANAAITGDNAAQRRAITGPNWREIRAHYRRTRSPKQTAALFNVPLNTLKARIRREGWSR